MKKTVRPNLEIKQFAPLHCSPTRIWRLLEEFRLALCCSALLLLTAAPASAATNIVLTTDDLQQKINEAVPGDILVLQGGAYSGSITINKPLSFVRSGTNTVQWLGAVTIQNTGTVAILQMNFSSTVTASGSNDLLLQDSVLNSTLNVNGGKFTMKRCSVGGRIDLTSVNFNGLRVTNYGGIYASCSVAEDKKFVLVQSQLGFMSLARYGVWLAYSTFSQVYCYTCDALVVGNNGRLLSEILGQQSLLSFQGGKVRAYGNRLEWAPSVGNGDMHIDGLSLSGGCTGEVVNNTIFGHSGVGNLKWNNQVGLRASSAAGVVVKGNIIQVWDWTGSHGTAIGVVGSSAEISEFSYCCVSMGGPDIVYFSGTVNPYNCIYSGPALNGDLSLAISSPCINAGPPEAFFNDRDGTRNDIGFTGGPYYQANGMTTDKPLLFWLMPSQRQVWKNAQPTLNMEAAATAGH